MVLLVSCLASLLIVSDVAMVNVALPSIVDALGLTAAAQQWFLDSYALAFSALPLLAGRLADVFGHRRLFLVGVTVFSASALGCTIAPDTAVLEVARALQGVGGAILASTTLSLLTSTYQGSARRRAVAIWSATVSGGAVVGILLGGVLTSELSWRCVFGLSVVVGAATILVTVRRLAPEPRMRRSRKLDITGSAAISAGLALLVAGLIGARTPDWSAATTAALLAAGVLVLLLFLRLERRSGDPLLPIQLYADRQRLAAVAVTALVGCNLYFLYFAVSVYLQRGQHHGPSVAAVLTLPAAVSVVAGSLGAPLLARLLTTRRQLLGSMLLLSGGFLWLSRLTAGGSYWTSVGGPLIVIGLGMGTSFVPATLLATAGVPVDRAGVASGVVNSSRQVGRALGLAALTGLVTSAIAAPSSPARIADGVSRAFGVCAGVGALGVVLVVLLLPREPRSSGAQPGTSALVDPVAPR